MVLLFIAHLYASGSAPASIVSTVSAVAYFHNSPSNCFMVSKLLAGARNLGTVPGVRLPVTLPVLSRLVHALPTVFVSRYQCLMLRAMMVLAFKAYLRIGEMVPRSRGTIHGCLHMDDVLLSGELITISFRRFKHSARQGSQSLQVRRECIQGTIIHPASFLREFQLARGNVQASQFAYPDGSPMLRSEFDVSLKRLLGFCGYKLVLLRVTAFVLGQPLQLH